MNSTQAFATAVGVGMAEWDKAYGDYEVLKVGRENLIIIKDIEEGFFIGTEGGIASSPNQNLSGVIDVRNHKTITFKGGQSFPYVNIGMWDKDMNWIRRGNYAPSIGDDTRVQVLDEGTKYIRISSAGLTEKSKLEFGNSPTPYTPSPKDINASPFTVKLAQDYYNQQTEINELRNAILQGGN